MKNLCFGIVLTVTSTLLITSVMAGEDEGHEIKLSATYTLGADDFNDFVSDQISDFDGGLDETRNLTRVHTFGGAITHTSPGGHQHSLGLEHEIDGESRNLTKRKVSLQRDHAFPSLSWRKEEQNGKDQFIVRLQGSYEKEQIEDRNEEFEVGVKFEEKGGLPLKIKIVPSAGFSVGDVGGEEEYRVFGKLSYSFRPIKFCIHQCCAKEEGQTKRKHKIEPKLALQTAFRADQIKQGPRVEMSISFKNKPFRQSDWLALSVGALASHNSDTGKPDGSIFFSVTVETDNLLSKNET